MYSISLFLPLYLSFSLSLYIYIYTHRYSLYTLTYCQQIYSVGDKVRESQKAGVANV